jgi:membrane peptidoglycan carboxypeptidase
MRRQAGSTMKPVVLAAALERGLDPAGAPYGPAYPIEDAPWTLKYDGGKQSWSPKDFEKDYRGWVPLRRALAESLNVPFARLANDIGLERVVDVAKRLGFEGEVPEVPSIALGSNEVTLKELARAYSTMAAHGIRPEITAVRAVTLDDGRPFARFEPKPEPALEKWTADWALDFLRSPFEIGSARGARGLGFTRPAFGKTGTTNESRDAWFVGGVPGGPITAVWVGFDRDEDREKIRLTGAEAALPIWVAVQNAALESVPVKEAEWNETLEEARIDLKTGKRATLSCPPSQTLVERYAKGRTPDEATCADQFPKGRP